MSNTWLRTPSNLIRCAPSTDPRFDDLTGMEFGRLVVAKFIGRAGNCFAFEVRCRCGNVLVVRGYCLTSGMTKSCGCLKPDKNKELRTTHGLGGSPIWRIWAGIKNRCYNKRVKAYHNYGGRGIKVCERWLTGDGTRGGFECFYADMGDRPSPEHSIDRYPDNDGDYEPTNCRWATDSQQQRNTQRTKYLEWRGQKKTAHEWEPVCGIPAPQILKRLGRGWSIERALSQPMRGRS